MFHTPVLLQSVVSLLRIEPGKRYIDATIGGGGHSQAILTSGGKVLGLDQDPESISACLALYQTQIQSHQLVLENTNFIHLEEAVNKNNWQPVSGIIFDLGVSSHQVDTPSRGFSFQSLGPLDMRMDPTLPNTAATLVNTLPERDLAKLFTDFGQIPIGHKLAKILISHRPIVTTLDFARLVPPQFLRQTFQAIRIAINDELGALSSALPQALKVLDASAVLVVISFHSLEDRLVKQAFSSWEAGGIGKMLTSSPVMASIEELNQNPRCKSARLRAFQKTI